MTVDLEIRRAEAADLDAIDAMERASFTTPWTRSSLASELSAPGRLRLIAHQHGTAAGYALVWVVADELHVVTLAVLPAFRRRGLASALLRAILESAEGRRAAIVTLEVRRGNDAARALYRKFGFREVTRRPRYYPDNQEDAVVMVKVLGAGDLGLSDNSVVEPGSDV